MLNDTTLKQTQNTFSSTMKTQKLEKKSLLVAVIPKMVPQIGLIKKYFDWNFTNGGYTCVHILKIPIQIFS